MRISTTRWTWPEVSPLRQSVWRERLKYQASPVSMVRASAAAFICATISTSPVCASVATQVTRPSASNLGASARPSSASAAGPGGANGPESLDNKSPLTTLPAHQREEAHLLGRLVAEQTGELGRHGGDPRLLHPA